jgi:hypothetical protein
MRIGCGSPVSHQLRRFETFTQGSEDLPLQFDALWQFADYAIEEYLLQRRCMARRAPVVLPRADPAHPCAALPL